MIIFMRMKKRIACSTAVAMLMLSSLASAQNEIIVSVSGDDRAQGTVQAPLRSLGAALDAAGKVDGDVVIALCGGVYALDRTETISRDRIGCGSLTITSYGDGEVVISGLKTLSLNWQKGKKGIWKAACDICPDQLYVNGEKRILARYPNFSGDGLWGGTAGDALSPERVGKWKNPAGGFIHSMHRNSWGSQHYIITGKDGDKVTYEGGWQVTRPHGLHETLLYVENIREELDAPGEWFWDGGENILYYIPFEGEDPRSETVQAAVITELIRIEGSGNAPVSDVTIRGISFTGTQRMFKEPYEMLLRSDWGILRKGAVTLSGTKDCAIEGCQFYDLGGNAIFISGYASGDKVSGNHIHDVGGSAICLVGDCSAVRSGSFGYGDKVPYDKMDKVPGPANRLYPRECVVENNLIHDLGQLEKQVAGVEIQVASHITVSHNSIYDVPRAGINIGDGCFGGHVIEYNDVFNTVLESGDHGSFNSWGRDRYWLPGINDTAELTREHPELILLDAIYTTTIRYNRFRCDHGWDIDLDDGSSNYHIYGNLCLSGGIKLREGYRRRVENNIVVNNSFHPHVWFPESGDVVVRNIWMKNYFPIALNGLGELVDYNFFTSGKALENVRKNGTDAHSSAGALSFSDPDNGDYSLPEGSEAFKTGFENIPMDRFGVISPELKAIAKVPDFPHPIIIDTSDKTKTYDWLGASVRPVTSLGDRSAYGLPDETGVIIESIAPDSPAAAAGLKKGDVLRTMEGSPLKDIEGLFTLTEKNRWYRSAVITYYRDQQESSTEINFK